MRWRAVLLCFLPKVGEPWGTEIVTLQAVNAVFDEESCIVTIFDKFGDGEHVKVLGNRDYARTNT